MKFNINKDVILTFIFLFSSLSASLCNAAEHAVKAEPRSFKPEVITVAVGNKDSRINKLDYKFVTIPDGLFK